MKYSKQGDLNSRKNYCISHTYLLSKELLDNLMFSGENDVFEDEENRVEFQEICSRLKDHTFPSPWSIFFKESEANEFVPEVSELVFPDMDTLNDLNTSTPLPENEPSDVSVDTFKGQMNPSNALLDKKKVTRLKESLISSQEDSTVEHLKDFDIFFIISSSQIPFLFQMLDASSLSDNAVTLLLNTFLHYKDQISIATATALVHYIICPVIFEMKKNNSRYLLSTILKFAEAYPKSVVDEIMIPYSKKEISDDMQSEILFQIAKTNLPNEYIPYTIKIILENALPIDSTFALLQCLIERKIYHDSTLNDLVLKKLLDWTPTCNKNVKFTKLLTSILSAYGNEFTEHQIQLCDEVVKSNKTIIKKAAENLLKRIKQERD